MCGRFAWFNKPTEIIDSFKTVDLNIEKNPIADIPSYNIAPSQKIIVIKSESKTSLTFHQMKWGLEPPKIKYGSNETFTDKLNLFNARADKISNSWPWQTLYENNRCLIPCSGYYEWTKSSMFSKSSTPFMTQMKDKKPFYLAGLFSTQSEDFKKTDVGSCTIITTEANSLQSTIHKRMPVIIPVENASIWLKRETHNYSEIQQLLKPYPSSSMEIWPVSNKIGDVRNNYIELIKPISKLLL